MKVMTIAAVAIGLIAATVQPSAYAARDQVDVSATEARIAEGVRHPYSLGLSQLGLDVPDTIGTTDPNFPDIVTALP